MIKGRGKRFQRFQPIKSSQKAFLSTVGTVKFHNGKIAYYCCSRMMPHGQEDSTEIIGTEGKVSININSLSNFVNYYHPGGITREVPATYYGRFKVAFVQETNEFTVACLDNTVLPMKLSNAVKAVQIVSWLQEALVSGKQLQFDEIVRMI